MNKIFANPSREDHEWVDVWEEWLRLRYAKQWILVINKKVVLNNSSLQGLEANMCVRYINGNVGRIQKIIVNGKERLIKDPFDLSIEDMRKLDWKDSIKLIALFECKYGNEIKKAFKERPEATTLVFCKEEKGNIEVVLESSGLSVSLKKVHKIEDERGMPCFIKHRPGTVVQI